MPDSGDAPPPYVQTMDSRSDSGSSGYSMVDEKGAMTPSDDEKDFIKAEHDMDAFAEAARFHSLPVRAVENESRPGVDKSTGKYPSPVKGTFVTPHCFWLVNDMNGYREKDRENKAAVNVELDDDEKDDLYRQQRGIVVQSGGSSRRMSKLFCMFGRSHSADREKVPATTTTKCRNSAPPTPAQSPRRWKIHLGYDNRTSGSTVSRNILRIYLSERSLDLTAAVRDGLPIMKRQIDSHLQPTRWVYMTGEVRDYDSKVAEFAGRSATHKSWWANMTMARHDKKKAASARPEECMSMDTAWRATIWDQEEKMCFHVDLNTNQYYVLRDKTFTNHEAQWLAQNIFNIVHAELEPKR